jgi:hypothetical protein
MQGLLQDGVGPVGRMAGEAGHVCHVRRTLSVCRQNWAKLILTALKRYSVELERITFNVSYCKSENL